MQTGAEIALTVILICLIVYAVIVDFELWALAGAVIVSGLVYWGLQDQLKAFVEHGSSHWTAVGLLVVFVSSFECTKHEACLYHMLAVMVVVCVFSMFLKTTLFAIVSVFVFVYLALSLLTKHIMRAGADPLAMQTVVHASKLVAKNG